ncbi:MULTISPECIES: hypothetical protein [Streptomyces]|uniref:ATP-binding protein n=1 Tax=Streptomyces morookaense TaxID=1970 RepID=A0A7Y7E6L0_STRMO|nr:MULTISPECIES: hypothetical protein [Streptomyces]MCC2279426.1 hypothetical protein [Streptomyces sp. ET3-23]NVK78000.1 hypothetical protein [Streptomyces morookaense]GHF16533.1 hypothetical protein GCM10010359_17510 [Streptomyces morookaense]
MKPGSLKILGAAALGLFAAAAGAGTASAATGVVESAADTAVTAWQTVPAEQVGHLVPAGGPVVRSADQVMNSGLPKQVGRAADQAMDNKLDRNLHPMDNKGNKGLLGLVPPGVIPSKGLSLGR